MFVSISSHCFLRNRPAIRHGTGQLTRMVHDGTIFNHRLIRGAMRFTKPKMPENQRNKPFFWSHHRGSWKGLCPATLTKVRRNFQVVEGRIRIKQYFQELTVLNCCWELRSEQWLCPYSLETFRTKRNYELSLLSFPITWLFDIVWYVRDLQRIQDWCKKRRNSLSKRIQGMTPGWTWDDLAGTAWPDSVVPY